MDGGGEPDFSSCPVLEDMELVDCLLSAPMTSHSLKRLTVRRCKFWNCCRIRVPRLVSLRLETLTDRGPQLDSMPLLVGAYVYIGHHDVDDDSDDDSSSDPGVTDDDSELDSGDDVDVKADTEKGVVLGALLEFRSLPTAKSCRQRP